jgi:hypothetical protein
VRAELEQLLGDVLLGLRGVRVLEKMAGGMYERERRCNRAGVNFNISSGTCCSACSYKDEEAEGAGPEGRKGVERAKVMRVAAAGAAETKERGEQQ